MSNNNKNLNTYINSIDEEDFISIDLDEIDLDDQQEYVDVKKILKDQDIKDKAFFYVSEKADKLINLLNDIKNNITQISKEVQDFNSAKLENHLNNLNEDFKIFEKIIQRSIDFKLQEEKENKLIESFEKFEIISAEEFDFPSKDINKNS
jgi:50S ribosomal subunit-associated GTPase HflX